MKPAETLKEFLTRYPESVLLKWLKSGQRSLRRKESGPSRSALANKRLKKMDLDKLQKDVLKE